jgi:predicted TIM-barrel fold metal-dependent hydrolase
MSWTAQQIARHPDRLVFAASVGALRDDSIDEVRHCATELNARAIKLNTAAPASTSTTRSTWRSFARLFAAIGELGLGVVLHLEPGRPYGRKEVEIFLNEIVSAAPDTPIQVAHLAGPGGDLARRAAVAEARAAGHPRTANLYFDLGGILYEGLPPAAGELGVDRALFGSDRMPRTENLPGNQ